MAALALGLAGALAFEAFGFAGDLLTFAVLALGVLAVLAGLAGEAGAGVDTGAGVAAGAGATGVVLGLDVLVALGFACGLVDLTFGVVFD